MKSEASVRFGRCNRLLLCLIAPLCLLLHGCGGDNGDDLDRFMREAAQGARAKIKPLPEVQPYVPFEYNADGALNDPFRPRKAVQAYNGNSLQPDLDRPRQPLEAYPLESLKFVGSISRSDKEKYSLRTGATQMMTALTERGGTGTSTRISEDALIDEMKGGRQWILIAIAGGVIALIVLIVLLAR